LAQFLPDLKSNTSEPADVLTLSKLKAVFDAFAQKREPRTTTIMNRSKNLGNLKCPDSPEGEPRRAGYFETIKFNGAMGQKMQDFMFGEPF
jgi:salicylate hydroxylase